MKIYKQIDSISSQQELTDFVNNLNFRITFLHGRKFYSKDGKGALSFNALTAKLSRKCQSNHLLVSSGLMKKLHKLNQDAQEALNKKNCFIRAMTSLKRSFIASSWQNNLLQLAVLEPEKSVKKASEKPLPPPPMIPPVVKKSTETKPSETILSPKETKPASEPKPIEEIPEEPPKPVTLSDRFKAAELGDDKALLEFFKDISDAEFSELLTNKAAAQVIWDRLLNDSQLLDFLTSLDSKKFISLFRDGHSLYLYAQACASRVWNQTPRRLFTFFKSLAYDKSLYLFDKCDGMLESKLNLNDISKIIKFLKSLSDMEFQEVLGLDNKIPYVLKYNVFDNSKHPSLIDCLNELSEDKFDSLVNSKWVNTRALNEEDPKKLISFLKELSDTRFASLFKKGNVFIFESCAQISRSRDDSFEIAKRIRKLAPHITEEFLQKTYYDATGDRHSHLLVHLSAASLLATLEDNQPLPSTLMPHFFAKCLNPSGEAEVTPKPYDVGSDRRLFGELLGAHCKPVHLKHCLEAFWDVKSANPRPAVVALLNTIVTKGNKEQINAAFAVFLPNREKFTGATLPDELTSILPSLKDKAKVAQILYHLPHDKEKTEAILNIIAKGWGMDDRHVWRLPFTHHNLNLLTPLIIKFAGELATALPCPEGLLMKDLMLMEPGTPSDVFKFVEPRFLKPYLKDGQIPVSSLDGITFSQWNELYDYAHTNNLPRLKSTLHLFLAIALTTENWSSEDFKNAFAQLNAEFVKEIKEVIFPAPKMGQFPYQKAII